MNNIQIAIELANELMKASFQSLTPQMAEQAVASTVQGKVCWYNNSILADVVGPDNIQYSVKSYTDKLIPEIMKGSKPERTFTPLIVERRIPGIPDPNNHPFNVFKSILQDVVENEKKSLEYNNTTSTRTVLVGHAQDEEYWYFRITETGYDFDVPHTVDKRCFTERSKNYNVYEDNIRSLVGYNEAGDMIYDWMHPNNQTFTRCLRKRYDLANADSVFFKIKKQQYSRPDTETLMSMIVVN